MTTEYSEITMLGGPVQVFLPFFFFRQEPFSSKPLQIEIKMTDKQQRERQFLIAHINRSIALANNCMPINHIIWLHQCQLPLIHNFATVRACWITFNMPWWSRFVAFLQQEQFCQKNLHARIIYTLATNRRPNNCNRMHTPLSNHP